MSTGFGKILDAAIVQLAQQGRADGQRQFFETYHTAVYRLMLGLCRDPQLAQDLSQEVFIKAFAKLKQLRDTAAVGGWLKQLAVNTALAEMRKPIREYSQDLSNEPLEDSHPASLEQSDWLSQIDDIEQLLDVLDQHERQLVWLYLVEGYNHEELAQWFAVPAATVRQRYHRALKKLQQGVIHANP